MSVYVTFEGQSKEASFSKELGKVKEEKELYFMLAGFAPVCIQLFFFLKDNNKSLSGQCQKTLI